MKIEFYKYQGTGNDFVMIDNRSNFFPKNNTKLVHFLCDRRFGIGADGLILLENDPNYDFRMVYYNADGNEGSMCGNGGRCLVAFAKEMGVISNQTKFIATDGEHHATIDDNELVSLQMIDVDAVDVNETYAFLNTGSPHHVAFVEDVKDIDVKNTGAEIRYSSTYAPKGTNVNFVSVINDDKFSVRTYERGVEDETYSCGTGVTAVALAMKKTNRTQSNHITLQTPGGILQVHFTEKDGKFIDVFLKGPALKVFKGNIDVNA